MTDELEPEDVAVERAVELVAPPEVVWAALTQPEGLSAWLGAEVLELELRPDGRGTVRRDDGGLRRISVESVEPGRRLSFRWWPFAGAGGAASVGSTQVVFLLEEREGGTLLRVIERAPLVPVRAAPDPAWPSQPTADLAEAGPSAANQQGPPMNSADRSLEALAR